MEKSVKDNPEYKMKRQGMIIGLVCLAVMVFLTIFLMSRYRQRTETIFTELMEESLLSTHSEALTEMENFLAGSAGADKVEEAWEALNEDEGNVLHYVCNSDGKILAGDMRIFDIEYTVATVLHSQHVKDNSISQVEKSLKKLTYGAPHIFTELEKTDIYLVASKLEGRDCILVSEYRSAKMKNYKAVLINGNRMIIFTLLGCALIMLLFTVRFYMKQQKKVMKGQARYDILSEFSDTVLFEYDCLEKTLVFTPNITTLFGLKEIGPLVQDQECKGYLLMLDIDDFKTVNDTMGHAIGDLALITLVKLLKEHFRREDIIGRLGGDEFIVFMTNTELASAVEAKGAEILDILAKSETTPHFTVSIGAAAYPAAGNDYESLYLAADNAMYASKKSGKNRIHVDNGQQKKE
ncbi:MAG: GGDEF domain-containing protein [Ruminococcus sp.]